MSIKLNDQTLEAVKTDKRLRAKVQGVLCISFNTMQKRLQENDQTLTTLDSLEVITEHLNQPLSLIISGQISKLLCQ